MALTFLFLCLFFSQSFSQDSKHSAENITSPSLDVFLPEDEDNPYESVTTAVTRKPCSLDINHRLNACPGDGKAKQKTTFILSHLQFRSLKHRLYLPHLFFFVVILTLYSEVYSHPATGNLSQIQVLKFICQLVYRRSLNPLRFCIIL